jgi:hypothetical protein
MEANEVRLYRDDSLPGTRAGRLSDRALVMARRLSSQYPVGAGGAIPHFALGA